MENTISDEELADLRITTLDELPHESVRYKEVVVTTAEILDLNTTDKVLVAAEAGKIHEFISATLIYDYESAAYATNGNLSIADDTGTALSNTVLLANLLAKTADYMVQLVALATADTGIVMAENEAINLICATGDPITGDSPLRVKVAYRTHTSGL